MHLPFRGIQVRAGRSGPHVQDFKWRLHWGILPSGVFWTVEHYGDSCHHPGQQACAPHREALPVLDSWLARFPYPVGIARTDRTGGSVFTLEPGLAPSMWGRPQGFEETRGGLPRGGLLYELESSADQHETRREMLVSACVPGRRMTGQAESRVRPTARLDSNSRALTRGPRPRALRTSRRAESLRPRTR